MRIKSLKISLWYLTIPLSLAPTGHFLRTDLFFAKQPESFSRGRPQGISVETGWSIKIGCSQDELLCAACSSKMILSFGRKSYTTHSIINNVLWTNCAISIWNTQKNWGRLLTNLPQFQCDRTNVITGKYSTILQSVCSLQTLVKFVASLKQIAVNKIAAFWLDTDRKEIILKKKKCCYPSSVSRPESGLLEVLSLG